MRFVGLALLAAAGLTTGLPQIAAAADAALPVKARPRPAIALPHWAGAYIGVSAGYISGRDTWSSEETDPAGDDCVGEVLCGPQRFKLSGGTVGGLIGVNFQQGNWVIGPELDFNFVSADGELTYSPGGPVEVQRVAEKIRGNAHARMRIGHAFGHWLPFVAAGVAVAKTKVELTSDNPPFETDRHDIYRVGFSAGGGFDFMFSPNAIFRAEYIYDQYGSSTSVGTPSFDQSSFNNLSTHTFRGALIWKFDDPGASFAAAPGAVPHAMPTYAAPTWAGIYIGASAGYLRGRDTWTSDETSPASLSCVTGDPAPCGPQPFNLGGWTAGGLIGANVQQGNWVIGPELDFNFVSADGQLSYGDPTFTAIRVSEDMRWNAHARVRFGHAFGPWLPFVAGGVALAKTRLEIENNPATAAFALTERVDVYRVGFSAGAGVDYKVAPNGVVRLEYLYDQYGNTTIGSSTFADVETFGSLHTHTVRAAAIWQLSPFAGGQTAYAAAYKAPAAAYTPWSGGYVGAAAGFLRGRDLWSSDEELPASRNCAVPGNAPPCGPQEFKLSGWTVGGLVGANFQQGNLVTGPEFDLNFVSAKRETLYDPVREDIERLKTEITGNAHARWRFGHAFGQWLPFVAGGAALALTKIEMTDDDAIRQSDTRNLYRIGFSAGGGVDYMVSPNAVLRLEYLYDRYNNATFGQHITSDQEVFALHTHTVRGAAIWKFGPDVVMSKY